MKNMAKDVKVGDVVEFDAGEPVLVMSIEDNYDEISAYNESPWMREKYGKSQIFGCSYTTLDLDVARIEGENTFYVRRELSPISGRVVR